MANPHQSEARKAHGDKLNKLIGKRGEYPPDRAARIALAGTSASAQGDAAKQPEEHFVGAPARQVSDKGRVKGEDD
jgi:hypothetical protein